MKAYAARLKSLIPATAEKLNSLDDSTASVHPAPGKWSPKEELGHLIDSAQNNIQRFLVAHDENQPKIVYHQNTWVRLNRYNSQSLGELIQLWQLLNQQLVTILEHLPAQSNSLLCDTGKNGTELHSLEWLAADYLVHLQHHMSHLLKEK